MNAQELLSRYEWNVGWNTETLLEVLVGLLTQKGEITEIVSHLDAIAEQEAEIYAGMMREEQ